MSRERPINGACSCGRNCYIIVVPPNEAGRAQVFFDESNENRRVQAAPLTAWLRVPIDWFQSYTQSYFPDETHSAIRRTFTPFHEPHCKRVFCGYCGTHLTYWSERPTTEADFLSVTVGSLRTDSIRVLGDYGLLPEAIDANEIIVHDRQELERGRLEHTSAQNPMIKTERHGATGDLTWFEELISGSAIGRTRRSRRGMTVIRDGATTIEWEVLEMRESDSGSESGTGRGKRKLGDSGAVEDTFMNE